MTILKTQLEGIKPADLVTMAGLAAGIASLAFSVQGSIAFAALAIMVAGAFDFADGAVARKTGSSSEFGKQIDSLNDMACFGAAPAALLFAARTGSDATLIAVFGALFAIGAAIRLARFNLQQKKRVFFGLPAPAAGIIVAVASVLIGGLPAGLVALACALLMVSTIEIPKPAL